MVTKESYRQETSAQVMSDNMGNMSHLDQRGDDFNSQGPNSLRDSMADANYKPSKKILKQMSSSLKDDDATKSLLSR